MTARDPEKNFEALWRTFHNRYPFFDLRNVDWNKQYEVYRPRISQTTSDDALFDITTPFPHTELWERTRDLIRKDFEDFDCFHSSVYELEGFRPSSIERMKKRAFFRFYLHPRRFFSTLRTVLGPGRIRRTLLKARRV